MTDGEKLITENLDVWTSAVKAKSSVGRGSNMKLELYGIRKLRELILQLAVMGMLVRQDKREQNAQDCLRVSNKGIIKFKISPSKKVPEGWLKLPLGCIIATNTGGGTPSKNNHNYWDGDIPWASVKDIRSSKYINTTIDKITREGLDNSSSNLIPPNRLIVVTRMGLGKLSINTIPIAINQDLRAIEPVEALSIDYGYLLFKTLNLVGKGMTVKGVTVKQLHSMQVLLPPLSEQHRIVAKVDELMALCDKIKERLAAAQVTKLNLADSLVEQAIN